MATFDINDRIIGRWDGSNFIEEALTLSGADGIAVSVDAEKFVISGNSNELQGDIAALSGYVDSQDAATLSSANSYTDGEISTLSGYVDSQDAATLSSANSYTDGEISSLSGYAEGAFVNVSGDTMTGFLTLHADPTDSGHATTKQYVDAQVSSAAINVEDNGSPAADSVGTLNFVHALSVTSGVGSAQIDVDESALSGVVFLLGDQTISGNKTLADDLVVLGDFTVQGTTTTLNTEELLVEDNIVVLNSTVTGSPLLDAGIEIERGDDTNAQLIWNETDDQWEAGLSGSTERILLESDLNDINGDIAALSGYVDSQDAATLSSANSYTDGEISTLSGYVDSQDAATLSSANSYTDGEISTLSGYVDSQDAATLSSANSYTDGEISSLSGYAEGAFVNISGDTMTGFLTLHADPTDSGHAATKQYVDAQVASAAINVEDNGSPAADSVGTLNFVHALAVTSGVGSAQIDVDESALSGVVFLLGDQTISGQKTFDEPVVLASGIEPAVNDAGEVGEIRWADDYVYICVASNTWKRAALATY